MRKKGLNSPHFETFTPPIFNFLPPHFRFSFFPAQFSIFPCFSYIPVGQQKFPHQKSLPSPPPTPVRHCLYSFVFWTKMSRYKDQLIQVFRTCPKKYRNKYVWDPRVSEFGLTRIMVDIRGHNNGSHFKKSTLDNGLLKERFIYLCKWVEVAGKNEHAITILNRYELLVVDISTFLGKKKKKKTSGWDFRRPNAPQGCNRHSFLRGQSHFSWSFSRCEMLFSW